MRRMVSGKSLLLLVYNLWSVSVSFVAGYYLMSAVRFFFKWLIPGEQAVAELSVFLSWHSEWDMARFLGLVFLLGIIYPKSATWKRLHGIGELSIKDNILILFLLLASIIFGIFLSEDFGVFSSLVISSGSSFMLTAFFHAGFYIRRWFDSWRKNRSINNTTVS